MNFENYSIDDGSRAQIPGDQGRGVRSALPQTACGQPAAAPAARVRARPEAATRREDRDGDDAPRSAARADAGRGRGVSEAKTLQIAIMGREFRVACPENEQASLLEAVDYLNRKMLEIRDAGKIIGL